MKLAALYRTKGFFTFLLSSLKNWSTLLEVYV
jgi:hypothetical protein